MTAVNAARGDLTSEVALRSAVRSARGSGQFRILAVLAVDSCAALVAVQLAEVWAGPGAFDAVVVAVLLCPVWPLVLIGQGAYARHAPGAATGHLGCVSRATVTVAAII